MKRISNKGTKQGPIAQGNNLGDKMNHKKVDAASEAALAAREAYTKAASKLLAAVKATPAEIEKAEQIIIGDPFPQSPLDYDENLAFTILEEVRGEW
jgi:hypothetical protein